MHFLVTGAARGIGAAICEAAQAAGHQVTACDIDSDALEARWQDAENVSIARLDVTDAQQWSAVAEARWQSAPVDVLVNVAGILRPAETGEMRASDIDLQFKVNTLGVIYGTNALAEKMIGRGSGHIINVGSTAGLFATPGNAVYAASKHAVRGFTIAAAGDLRPHGVNVSLVAPTAVQTEMLDQQRGDHRAALSFEGKRALTPQEVAQMIIGEVLEKKPLETYLPSSDHWTGRLCTAFPELFLKVAKKAREKGVKNFNSAAFGGSGGSGGSDGQ
ncbi:SDR family oxidoreductase [Microbulbifer sp. YPW1]|uniref:SDR family NAD(P)-dependent oxidoreductase n=1 Tax=Microbulbifer sp. YPW1 TaxID=2745199 RepID=UPI00159841AE|nr:SDR family oxidoreductase [Microbulbifer sp. YPW1]QKX17205.1 SDR family oxidoreductase [Microbulbifer sp. YPW1]